MKKNKVDRSDRRGTGVSFPLVIGSMVMVMILFPYLATTSQAIQAQGQQAGGNVQVGESPPVQPAEQGGQPQHAGDQPVDVADIEEDEMTAFDPSTIPDAAPTPEADWLFEVPIDVEGISAEVQQIGIKCEVFLFGSRGQKITHGDAKRKIDLENGAYHGNVLIGVMMYPGASVVAHLSDKYTCWTYLVGPSNNWHVPKQKQTVSPGFRRMSKERPFRWQTGAVSIPPDARFSFSR